MSSGNLDLVRSIYEAWGRGDFSSTEWAHPEIEYGLADGFGGRWVGVEGMTEGFRDWIRVWRDWTVTAEDYVELEGDRILVLFSSSGRMKGSGPGAARVQHRGATVFQVRGQMIIRIDQYNDRSGAFADLGISPED